MAAAWSRVNTIVLLLVLFALLALIGMVASGVRGGPLDPTNPPASTDSVRLPGTPISGQFTISTPGHYYLTRDVRVTGAQNGITISASEVSVDLGGFRVDGNDTIGTYGIIITGSQTDITIENGVVKDFHVGLHTNNGQRVRADGIQALSNVRGMEIGAVSVVSDCVSSSNAETGIYLSALGSSTTITNCVVTANILDGIGIDGQLNVVKDSVVQGNGNIDVYINQGSRTTVRDNTVDSVRIEVDSFLNYVFDNVCVQGGITNAAGGGNYAPTFTATNIDPHYNAGC